MSNELVDLVLFHGRHEGFSSFKISDMRQRYRGNDLASAAWLPIYEVYRRGWDASASFSKIGTADDPNGLYEHLRLQGVEFYVTDPEQYEVEAFSGWHLTQQDFEAGENNEGEIDDWDHHFAYFAGDGWENYE